MSLPPHLPPLAWPLPALLAWAAAWALLRGLPQAGAAPGAALGLALLLPLAVAAGLRHLSRWRRVLLALGFPLALGLAGVALPAWAWLLPALALWGLYPRRAWRDAPFFPTPRGALTGLAEVVQLPAGAVVLDAGCGAGHGLAALRQALPQAALQGLEWSRPLAWWAARWAAWRCPGARVRRADMWAAPWGGADLVYLFQRPDTMARAWRKANAEMRPGSWLASLEFPVPGVPAQAVLPGAQGRPVHLYRLSGDGAAQPTAGPVDNPRSTRRGPNRRGG